MKATLTLLSVAALALSACGGSGDDDGGPTRRASSGEWEKIADGPTLTLDDGSTLTCEEGQNFYVASDAEPDSFPLCMTDEEAGGSSEEAGGGSTPSQTEIVNCSSFAGQALTAEDISRPCRVDDATSDLLDTPVGELYASASGTTLCEDGSVLFYNNIGWGYENDVFTLHSEEAEPLPPADVRERCESEPATT